MDKIIIYSLHGGVELFLFDDDEEETVLEKIVDFAEFTVPRYNDRQFQEHFRMTPNTFDIFLSQLNTVTGEELPTKGPSEMPLDKQLMISIWCMGNLESFRSVANKFGISKSTCWEVLYRTCHRILKVNQSFRIISWPTRARQLEIMEGFRHMSGFPGAIGAIDGTHVRIQKPREFGNSYFNRKGYPSVLLQGVCDHNRSFTDVYTGQPGSIHDAKLFRKSDLYNRIWQNEIQFDEGTHLIGDLAYTLAPYLMVGFKNPAILTDRQKNYNVQLSKQRVVIENAYALWRARFRRMKLMETVRLDLISLLIVASCILHNVCISNNDEAHFDIERQVEEDILLPDDAENVCPEDQHDAVFASRKRLGILNRL